MFSVRPFLTKLSLVRESVRHASKQSKRKGGSFISSNLKSSPNPGVDLQLSAMDLDRHEMEDPEVLEEMEKSFWDVGKMHSLYEREKEEMRDKKGLYQVERKYNKVRYPNMLLWSEKEHIRFLHEQDSETWNIIKLAESFPASPDVIKGILKAKWKMSTPEQIAKHDKRVVRNWEALVTGKLDILDEDLRKHLLTFCNRQHIVKHPDGAPVTAVEVVQSVKEEPTGVFTNIILSYEKRISRNTEGCEQKGEPLKQNMDPLQSRLSSLAHPPKRDTYVAREIRQFVATHTKQPMTMEAMQQKVLAAEKEGKTIKEVEKLFIKRFSSEHDEIMKPVNDPVSSPVEPAQAQGAAPAVAAQCVKMHDSSASTWKKDNVKDITKYKTADLPAVQAYINSQTDCYPLKIEIPKNKWKKGSLYKLKDCFYADDGEFLYRVPGMSSGK